MILYKKITLILLTIIFLSEPIYSQEIAPIEKYTPEIYSGGNQNWSISQDSNNFIYVANNEGLLEFNGSNWSLYPVPNKSIPRSVNVIDDKIYTGCFMEFGYWERNKKGLLEYTSLSKQIKEKIQQDEQFWKIINFEKWIIFQSLNNIYLYDTKLNKFTIFHYEDILTKAFTTDKSVYFHVVNQGVYKINEGRPELIIKANLFNNDWVTNIYDDKNGLLLITQKNGFFRYSEQSFSKWKNDSDILLSSTTVYSSMKLKDNSFLLGTISQGIIHLHQDGTILNRYNQNNGLSNNTVLSLFEDNEQNIWAGLDNGINCVNLKSPIKIYDDYKGDYGTIYTSVVFNNLIYIGTNQGLYYKNLNQIENFKFIQGTKGQVWSLYKIDNSLLCGHDSGTFQIENSKARLISNIPGTWSFKKIPLETDLILQGHYTGLSILQKVNGNWKFRNKIKGFNTSSRFFEFDQQNTIWVNHEYSGLYKLKVNANFKNIIEVQKELSIPKGKNSSIVLYKEKLLYASKDGIFYFDKIDKKFQKDSLLSKMLKDDYYISGKLIVDETDKLWLFTKENIYYVSPGQFSNEPIINKIPIPLSLRKAMIGYENITLLGKSKYLIGKADGYITLDLAEIKDKKYSIYINSIKLKNLETQPKIVNLIDKGNYNYTDNSFEINFSVPEYDKHLAIDYQYQVEGYHNSWIHLENQNKVNLDNLPHGDYIFKVRARIGNDYTINEASYYFQIHKPWYISNIAWFIYFLFTIALTVFIHKSYKKHFNSKHAADLEKRKKEMEMSLLENKQQIMKVKNEQLKLDIENKNRELAISTMSIIKKNKVLNNIKKEFLDSNSELKNKSVLRLIDKNLNDKDDWEFFEEAFNNADKNFMKKVKKLHPNLTPNDLRLCAYLRLNLSSKEIANLLNISVRSVEIKRYRLRKKMELLHDTSLVNYILEI